jgi:hypothetical protein
MKRGRQLTRPRARSYLQQVDRPHGYLEAVATGSLYGSRLNGTTSWADAFGRGAVMSDHDTVTFACEASDRAVALLSEPERRV